MLVFDVDPSFPHVLVEDNGDGKFASASADDTLVDKDEAVAVAERRNEVCLTMTMSQYGVRVSRTCTSFCLLKTHAEAKPLEQQRSSTF